MKAKLSKEKWTLSFDAQLKALVKREAKKKGVYPVQLLEEMVKEKLNPFGHQGIEDSVQYVNLLRNKSANKTDEAFLKEIFTWQKQASS